MKTISLLCEATTTDGMGSTSHAVLVLDVLWVKRLRAMMALCKRVADQEAELLGFGPGLKTFSCPRFELLDAAEKEDGEFDVPRIPVGGADWESMGVDFGVDAYFADCVVRDDLCSMIVYTDHIVINCYEKHTDIRVTTSKINEAVLSFAEAALVGA